MNFFPPQGESGALSRRDASPMGRLRHFTSPIGEARLAARLAAFPRKRRKGYAPHAATTSSVVTTMAQFRSRLLSVASCRSGA